MVRQKTGEYIVSRLSATGLQDLAGLYREVYGRAIPVDYFIKKYDTSFTGIENMGFIARKDNRPVAYYGVIPCYLKNGNERILAAQSVDTMTHPHHRRKNLFIQLARLTFELCRENGVRIIFGFPNQNSIAGFQKLGWITAGDLDFFEIPLSRISLPFLARRFGLLRKSRISSPKNKINGLISSAVSEGFAGPDRDDAFLAYRQYNGTSVLDYSDYKCWVSMKDHLIIGDISGYNEMNFTGIIQQLVHEGQKKGLRTIQFHCSPGTQLHRLFLSHYPARKSFAVMFHDLGSNLLPENIKFTFADTDLF